MLYVGEGKLLKRRSAVPTPLLAHCNIKFYTFPPDFIMRSGAFHCFPRTPSFQELSNDFIFEFTLCARRIYLIGVDTAAHIENFYTQANYKNKKDCHIDSLFYFLRSILLYSDNNNENNREYYENYRKNSCDYAQGFLF